MLLIKVILQAEIGKMKYKTQEIFETYFWNKAVYISVIQSKTGINSWPSGDTYMRQWIGATLVQIMNFPLFGAKPVCKSMLGHYLMDSYEQGSGKFRENNQNPKVSIHDNASVNILSEMAALLSRGISWLWSYFLHKTPSIFTRDAYEMEVYMDVLLMPAFISRSLTNGNIVQSNWNSNTMVMLIVMAK